MNNDKDTNKKSSPGVGGSTRLADAIRRIALHGVADPESCTVFGARRVAGYVAKVNDNKTVDVQEYLDVEENSKGVQEGYHEGVWLSALESNPNGYLIVPKLYSEVVIAKDPVTLTEFVVMYSHVDIIQLESSDTVTVGVVEREELNLNDDNSPDVDELEATGLSGKTTYTKDEVKTEVIDEDGSKTTTIDMKSDSLDFSVSDGDDAKMHMDKSEIVLERGKSKTTLKDGENTMENGNEKVKVTNSVVYLGNDSGTSHAVLGEELADILMDFLGYCSQIKTTTKLGPQPPLNLASFIALKAKITAYKSACSNFLTRKVEIQK